MEAMLLSSTPDQSISQYSKHNRNPRKMFHSFVSRPTENFAPSSFINLSVHGGLIGPPPSISSNSLSNHDHDHHHHRQQRHTQQTPPLLPLPVSSSPSLKSHYSSLPSRSSINNIIENNKILATTSSVPTNRKTNSKSRGGGVDVTAKKPRSSPRSRKQLGESDCLRSDHRVGPDPRDLPKKVSGILRRKSKVLLVGSVTDEVAVGVVDGESDDGSRNVCNGGVVLEEISCSIFSLAPPPSSLPLPKFSLKPKLGGCNVFDAGATDNLRRLLRLR